MIQKWTAHLAATRAPRTVTAYVDAATRFVAWHKSRGLTAMTSQSLQEYVDAQSELLAPRSLRLHVSAIREFLRYCGYTATAPRLPRVEQTEARHLDEGQEITYQEIVKSIDNPGVRVVLALLPMTGLRIRKEMLALRLCDVTRRSDGWWLTVHGKGCKVRNVPLDHRAQAILKEYLEVARLDGPDVDPIAPLFRVGYDVTYDAIKTVGTKMGLPWLHPHVLRHTFATRLREHGVNVADIQDLLGHAKLATTVSIYAHATDVTRRSAVRKLEGDQEGDQG